MAKTIELEFDGYWRDENRGSVPNNSGVYLVYRCIHNKDKEKSTVTLNEIIYIGEAGKVQERIEGHEKRECWEGELKKGEQLCFSFAPATKDDRERAEAALIYKLKPTCNEEYKDSFPFEETTVKNTGQCALMPSSFTVKKSV